MSSLRRIEVKDIYHLHDINVKCLPENYPMEFYLSIVIKYSHISWVILDKSQPIGYILLTLEPLTKIIATENPLAQSGYISSIAVMPAWRRNGMAQKLINAAISSLTSIGVVSTHLHVRAGNIGAISLYKKIGYVIVSIESKYYNDGEDAFLMQKIIN